jgi:Sulfotransferase family
LSASQVALVSEAPETSHPGRIPVLFIAGAARSGSTLLDRVIGLNDGFCSTGELQFIWQRSFGEDQLCGCGVPFYECHFWKDVSELAFGVDPAELDAEAACRMKAAIEDKRRVPWLLASHSPAELADYGELIERLYAAILHVSGARVIVDSSKDPRHGLVLSKLERIDLHVVHLVRDPRAVAFSWRRPHERPEIYWKRQNMTLQPVRAAATRWTTHNAVVELLRRSAASYCRVRYEDFVADPRDALGRILAPYEWATEIPECVASGRPVLEPSHSVAGNPMRFKNGQVSVKLDDEWRRAMPLGDRFSVAAVTWPLLARYGYHLRVAR